jgi:hypothetical protein
MYCGTILELTTQSMDGVEHQPSLNWEGILFFELRNLATCHAFGIVSKLLMSRA